MGDYGGNCSNVNVKGTNECCAASTKGTNGGSENNSVVNVQMISKPMNFLLSVSPCKEINVRSQRQMKNFLTTAGFEP